MSVSNSGSHCPAGIRRARFMRKWPGAIYHGKNFFLPLVTNVACRRRTTRAISEWQTRRCFGRHPCRIHPFCESGGEIEPVLAAKEYEAQLDVLAAKRGEKIYEHDLILLGLGDDGHTASLFPGTEALSETERRVMANYVPKLNSWRLTFTFPLVFAARAVCFLIGANKDPRLIERIFSGDPALPAARVDQNAKSV